MTTAKEIAAGRRLPVSEGGSLPETEPKATKPTKPSEPAKPEAETKPEPEPET